MQQQSIEPVAFQQNTPQPPVQEPQPSGLDRFGKLFGIILLILAIFPCWVSMVKDGEMMQKYADFADKIDKYDSNSMSTEDSKYYIEVTTRCAQKMLEVY